MPNFDACKLNPILFLTVVFTSLDLSAQVFPVDTLLNNGNRNNRIIFSYLSDGYQSAQLSTYITNATAINNGLFAQTPFSQYKNFFNAYAVRVPSTDAGAKHPGTASDESTSNGQPVVNPNNYFSSTFDYGSIHRLLVPINSSGMSGILASNVPDYDQGFIVVNSPYYGGSGGTYATASTHTQSVEVAIHEIGHSFAGLADEYWAGDVYAAEKPNMTQNSNPTTVKWKNWYNLNGIGIYPYGSSGNQAVWYRPHQLCKMQYLGYPFCSVCTERFVDRIHQLVNMIDSYLPATTSYSLPNRNPATFSVVNLQSIPSTIKVNWYLNGSTTAYAANQSSVTIPFATFNTGNNILRAEVVDTTTLSKTFLPAVGYVNSITWTVYKDPALPIKLLSFAGKLNNHAEAELFWNVESTDDLKNFDVESSRDGINFTTIATVSGKAGTKNYQFTDPKMNFPTTWYRLIMNEKSGTVAYSNILKITNPFDRFYYKIFQDADAHKYHVSCLLNTEQPVSLRVISISGTEVYKKNFGIIKDRLEADFNLENKAAGVYFANIQIGSSMYTVPLSAN